MSHMAYMRLWVIGNLESGDVEESPMTKFSYVLHVDLKGWFPSFVVNSRCVNVSVSVLVASR